MPAACARARVCRMVLVEPPIAMSRMKELTIACSVMISSGRTFFSRQRLSACAAWRVSDRRSGLGSVLRKVLSTQRSAGMVPLPGSATPRASPRQFMELAVNMPAQLPQPGQAVSASFRSSPSVILPTLCLPTASKTVIRSVLPGPASIGPPLR